MKITIALAPCEHRLFTPCSLWQSIWKLLEPSQIASRSGLCIWALTLSQCYQWQYLYIIETKLLVFSFSSLKIMPFPSVFLHIQFLNILNEQKGFLKAFVWFGCWFLKYIILFPWHMETDASIAWPPSAWNANSLLKHIHLGFHFEQMHLLVCLKAVSKQMWLW